MFYLDWNVRRWPWVLLSERPGVIFQSQLQRFHESRLIRCSSPTLARCQRWRLWDRWRHPHTVLREARHRQERRFSGGGWGPLGTGRWADASVDHKDQKTGQRWRRAHLFVSSGRSLVSLLLHYLPPQVTPEHSPQSGLRGTQRGPEEPGGIFVPRPPPPSLFHAPIRWVAGFVRRYITVK